MVLVRLCERLVAWRLGSFMVTCVLGKIWMRLEFEYYRIQ